MKTNHMELSFSALSQNESLARIAISAFVVQIDPTIEELTEIKTVISEAVTNCIIHGYENDANGIVQLTATIDYELEKLEIEVHDDGLGIADVEEARQPLFTSKPELERSGMGFTIMENFVDDVVIESTVGVGTTVKFTKYFTKKTALVD